jgi:hypothetical protein
MNKVYVAKVCRNCGTLHLAPPPEARVAANGDVLDGYYWECGGQLPDGSECRSTLFLPARKLEAEEAV